MKVITLIPVRNEAWILPYTLRTLSTYSDHIIIADQMSTDGSREIYKQFSKVTVIDNKREGHSNEVRSDLLAEARKIPGNNLILCIDADEMISPSLFRILLTKAIEVGPGHVFSLPWIQLWKRTSVYRTDGPWNNNFKQCAFYDDRTMSYPQGTVINDHTGRVPSVAKENVIELPNVPLIHLQFLAWNRMQIKQAWYRMSELIASPSTARRINYKYKNTLDSSEVKTSAVPMTWIQGLAFPEPTTLEQYDEKRLGEIKAWFSRYTISFFEPLQIWNISILHEIFLKALNREPRPKTYPKLLEYANTMVKRLLR